MRVENETHVSVLRDCCNEKFISTLLCYTSYGMLECKVPTPDVDLL